MSQKIATTRPPTGTARTFARAESKRQKAGFASGFLYAQKYLASLYFCTYNNHTQIEFGPIKDQINKGKHGVSLAMAEAFEMDVALVWADDRFDYGETRFNARGPIGDYIYSLSFTIPIRGETLRAISLRRATRTEVLKYVNET